MRFTINMLLQTYLILFIYMETYLTRNCYYKAIPKEQQITGIRINNVKHKYDLSNKSKLRIHFEYTDRFARYKNSEQLKQEILIPAKKQLESLLFVKNPLKAPIRVDRACINNTIRYNPKVGIGCATGCQLQTRCATVDIPSKLLNKCKLMSSKGVLNYTGEKGSGVSWSDIALVVDVKTCNKDVLAYSASCFLEEDLDRPILGIVVLCNNVINAGKRILYNRGVIQHEIIHTLGFSPHLYAFFRDQDGKPIVPRSKFNKPSLGYDNQIGAYIWNDKVAMKVTRNRSNINGYYTKTVYAITLPTVLEVGKKHFNCSQLDGVDLEDYPFLSHFSEYLLYNEIMTPNANDALHRMSKFTLALLRDTGWYDVDLDTFTDYSYGKDSGCGIIFDDDAYL